MARDHARVNLALWNDDDFLDLPYPAQHLYLVLWTHPDLSYAGVVDWHPGRIASRAAGWTVDEVNAAAQCLEARLFIVIDHETQECLIRSWVRWDGLMKQPIMAVSFAKARASVASREIRGVIVHEALRLRDREPELAGWAKPQVQELLENRALDPRSRALPQDPFTPGLTPDLTLSATPDSTPTVRVNRGVGGNPSPYPPSTTTPTTTPVLQLQTSEIADALPDTPRDDVRGLCELLADAIEDNGVRRPQITKRWHDAARLLLDKDGYTLEQVEWMIRWATTHEFWRANILSMPKLREKFDQMRLQAMQGRGRSPMGDAETTLALAAELQAEHDRAVGQ